MATLTQVAIAAADNVQPLAQRDAPTASQLLDRIPENIDDATFDGYDHATFNQHMISQGVAPILSHTTDKGPTQTIAPKGSIEAATWGQTQLAIKDLYHRVEQGYGVFFAAAGVETTLPQTVTDRAQMFQWSDPKEDNYPPHFEILTSNKFPTGYEASKTEIFNRLGLLQSIIMVKKIVPKTFIGTFSQQMYSKVEDLLFGNGSNALTMEDLENSNSDQFRRKTATDIMQGANIGDLPDWFSDAKFAQQQFTGTNPCTIKAATEDWIMQFRVAASLQKTDAARAATAMLWKTKQESLYIQDSSFFRVAVGAKPDDPMKNEDRFQVAPVTLFLLTDTGLLHPIAICIDYHGSMAKSVVIFNKNLQPASDWDRLRAAKLETEKQDWPWRFAKQCSQTADWVKHEVGVHLTHTHLIEEAIIVAANRVLTISHPVFKLLEPHWYRTLPLNAAARATLVPSIIFDLIGLADKQPYQLIQHFYKTYNFQDGYVPSDLKKRGFPLEQLDDERYRNYVYGKNALAMWYCIRKFVSHMLNDPYPNDEAVASDKAISAWCEELHTFGQMPSFPTIKTCDQLFDAVTMCIHIAAPQHTAVNYLQNFYHVFIPSKPPALWAPPPKSLDELLKYKEADVLKALPINHQREWLMATQIPWLLSFKATDENSLLKYASSLYNLVRKSAEETDLRTKLIATDFYNDLRQLVKQFAENSDAMTRGSIPYVVMDPAATAISILI